MTLPAATNEAAASRRAWTNAVVVALLILGLPLAVWADLRHLTDQSLDRQAGDLSQVVNDIRRLYASDVVARIQQAGAGTPITTVHDFRDHAGAIPIPATFSIELGSVIRTRDGSIKYDFVSDLPFKSREPYKLDAFQQRALDTFRKDKNAEVSEVTGPLFDRSIRLASPIIMEQACVTCHNSHPESPKTDWKVGDVRGIQALTVAQPIAANIFGFKYLLGYFAVAAAVGIGFIAQQKRQASLISGMNHDLTKANAFLDTVAKKVGRYLSPQIFASIFSGERDVTVATERKKLTIFFSDIKDFTATTERMQPEDLTAVLNEYLTEMSRIAARHGGTVDKFIGDAILIFFGDPHTNGVEEDARACLRMAIEMQTRLAELGTKWRDRGVERPFQARMGINTGYCNVGNFGSEERVDYTIIGAEANLAARLQGIAEPGKMAISYETFALVRDLVRARPLEPIVVKGVARPITPYLVEEALLDAPDTPTAIEERSDGLTLVMDAARLTAEQTARARRRLEAALALLGRPAPAEAEPR